MLNLSIVIATWNRPDYLRRCLASIPLDLVKRVIVVDDGSDTPVEVPDGVMLIQALGHTGLPGRMRHVGIQQTDSEFVTIVDDDDYLAPGGLMAVGDYMEAHPDADLMSTLSVYTDGRPRPGCEQAARGAAFMGHLVVMRRALYESVGGFALDLPVAMNSHLHYRLHAASPCQLIPFPAYVIEREPHDSVHVRYAGVYEHLWRKHVAGNLDFYKTLPLK